ncbi:RPII140-upstream gene protein isoform X2 [Octopus sinensis]|uniref:Complex I assembly factor TIMMDC1, mitochondrial n=1 Tax=Octopus sinensis TaxID=2607531 RepID=A0A7E6EGU3_9MOLL|nr:RPII140-upstream gene protein isoform X2 [Octopus sinensis]
MRMDNLFPKGLVPSQICSTSFYQQFRSSFWFPRIYASEVETPLADTSPPIETQTQPTDALIKATENLRKQALENKLIISELDIQKFLSSETGWYRLQKMYSKDIQGNYSPELNFIGSSLFKIGLLTFCVCSFVGGREASDKFIKDNNASVFRTKFQANRMLTDRVVLAGMKSGVFWSYRTCFFSSVFLLLSQSIAVYRNKSSVWEYLIASGITGMLLKVNLGLRGMVSGGIFGSLMGLCGGSIIYGFMVLTNETQDQRHYWEIQKYLEEKKQQQAMNA